MAFGESTIAEWTPTTLTKFIQDLLATQPPGFIPLLKAEQVQVDKNLIVKDLLSLPNTSWRYVGLTGQPAFQNSWVNYGTGWASAGFYKDPMGWVHLRGLVKSGTPPNVIFTLPPGFRPSVREVFATVSNDLIGRCDVAADGTVIPAVGSSTWFSLSGISFRTS